MKKSFLILFLVLALGLTIGSNVMAQTYVSETGSDSTGNGSAGAPYATITKALSMGATQIYVTGTITDTVGTDTDSAIVVNQNVTIEKEPSAASAIIQPATSRLAAQRRVFYVSFGRTVTMRNLTIRYGKAKIGGSGTDTGYPANISGGDGADGGGIYNAGTLTLESCLITENDAGNGGAGMDYDSVITGAGATGGTGGPAGDTTAGTAGGPGNEATGAGGVGGTGGTAITIGNPTGYAGGIGGTGGTGSTGKDGGNGGHGGNGGGIYNAVGANLTLISCTFTNNNYTGTTITGGIGGDGGKGGNGGVGGQGGAGGAGGPFVTNPGDGGQGGTGGAGGNAGKGGDGGDSGRGGAIYNEGTLITRMTTFGSTTTGNRAGYFGTGKTSGAAGNGGYGGVGGWNSNNTIQASAGVPGSAGISCGDDHPEYCGTDGNPGLGNNGWNATTDIAIANPVDPNAGTISLMVKLASFTAKDTEEGVLLKWKTLSETENAGFHILRSKKEKGRYLRITEYMISAEGEPTSGAVYSYVDNDVEDGETYYYKLEDIDYSGKSTYHGPVSAKVEADED